MLNTAQATDPNNLRRDNAFRMRYSILVVVTVLFATLCAVGCGSAALAVQKLDTHWITGGDHHHRYPGSLVLVREAGGAREQPRYRPGSEKRWTPSISHPGARTHQS